MSRDGEMRKVDARQEVVRLRLRGTQPQAVADELGLTVEEVHTFFREFLQRNYTDLGEVEMRLTQLARLESMVNMLWSTVEAGDQLSEGRQTANMLKVIEEINKLLGLHRDPLRDAQVQLTKVQTELVHLVMTELRTRMLTQVMQGVRGILDAEDTSEQVTEAITVAVDSSWSEWFSSAYDVSIKAVKQIEEGKNG